MIVTSSRTLSLSWSLPPVIDRNGVISGYRVRIQNSSATSLYTVTGRSLLVSGLLPYQTYRCSVTAYTAEGQGPYSRTLAARTSQAGESWSSSLPSHEINHIQLFMNKHLTLWLTRTDHNDLIFTWFASFAKWYVQLL